MHQPSFRTHCASPSDNQPLNIKSLPGRLILAHMHLALWVCIILSLQVVPSSPFNYQLQSIYPANVNSPKLSCLSPQVLNIVSYVLSLIPAPHLLWESASRIGTDPLAFISYTFPVLSLFPLSFMTDNCGHKCVSHCYIRPNNPPWAGLFLTPQGPGSYNKGQS